MGRVGEYARRYVSLTHHVSHLFSPFTYCHLPLAPILLYVSLQTLTLSGPVRAKLDTLRKMCVHPQFGLEMVSGRGGGGTGDRPMSILQVLEARLDEAKQKQASAEDRRARKSGGKSGSKSGDKPNKRPRKSTQLEQRITFLENQLASAKTAHLSEQARLKASNAAVESSGTGGAGGDSSAAGGRLTGPKSFHDGSSSSSSSSSTTADADAAAGGGPNDAGEEGETDSA